MEPRQLSNQGAAKEDTKMIRTPHEQLDGDGQPGSANGTQNRVAARDHNDGDGLQVQRQERRKQVRRGRNEGAVYGTRKDQRLVGGCDGMDIFVFRVNNRIGTDDVKNFLEEEGTAVAHIEKKSHEEARMKSFLVTIDNKKKDMLSWMQNSGQTLLDVERSEGCAKCRLVGEPRFLVKVGKNSYQSFLGVI